MDQKNIEQLFRRGQYAQALENLVKAPPSSWRDTAQLRCLRAMGRARNAREFADQLYQTLLDASARYTINTSEKNHQLRYIALVFAEQGRAQDACDIMQDLVDKSPDLAALHREYAFALSNANQLDKAEFELIKALRLQPQNANSHAQLARIYCRTGRVNEGYNGYARAATLEPDNSSYLQRLVYWSNYLQHTTQQSNYQLARKWAAATHPEDVHANLPRRPSDSPRPLRLAFVSADFCAHAISFFVLPLLTVLNREQFHVSAYSDTKKIDSVSASIRQSCDVWFDSARLSDRELSKQINSDAIDVLIDLGGHTSGNRLGVFAERAAPLQVSWLGYPATSGLSNIDCRITDRIADPVGALDHFFSEELLRLPNGFLCYQPLATAPDIAVSYDSDNIRFGSFNNLAKISPQTLDAWSSAMLAVPNSTLYLKRQQFVNENCKAYFMREFERRGINSERLILRTSTAKIEQHLNEYNNVDIALDTFPYNGVTTTLEALWMGVPVVTLTGPTHASRVSASILQRVNLGNLACQNDIDFIERVEELSYNANARSALREGLRNTMRKSALMNYQQFANEFGQALLKKWQSLCDQGNQEQAATKSALIGDAS